MLAVPGQTCADCLALSWLPQSIMTIPNHPATAPAPILQLRDIRYAAEPTANELLQADLFTWLSEIEGASPQKAAERN